MPNTMLLLETRIPFAQFYMILAKNVYEGKLVNVHIDGCEVYDIPPEVIPARKGIVNGVPVFTHFFELEIGHDVHINNTSFVASDYKNEDPLTPIT